jgi:hypothetical protein
MGADSWRMNRRSGTNPSLAITGDFTHNPNECNGDITPVVGVPGSQDPLILLCMEPEATDEMVWIGVVGIVPRNGCEFLSPDEGAYVNFLTLASSDSEYRAKVVGALSDYQLELLEFEDVRPFSVADCPSAEILAIAAELQESANPQHVRYATFNTFPRKM